VNYLVLSSFELGIFFAFFTGVLYFRARTPKSAGGPIRLTICSLLSFSFIFLFSIFDRYHGPFPMIAYWIVGGECIALVTGAVVWELLRRIRRGSKPTNGQA